MPVLLKRELPNGGEYGIWHITEPEAYFADRIELYPEEKVEVKTLTGRKRLEWYSSRYLLHLMSGRNARAACIKDQHGKPYLRGSTYHISMSHSRDRVAVIASPKIIGIDIQEIVDKISRIAPKFVNESEYTYIDLKYEKLYYHVIWGAKECLYKAYGKRGLDFRKHIFIDPFVYNPNGVSFGGSIVYDSYKRNFKIHSTQLDDYILVYATILD